MLSEADMSVETHATFVQRLNLLGRKHAQMSKGYTTKVGPDGLITVRPKRARIKFPLKSIVIAIIAFIGFKAFLLAANGPAAYQDRLASLESGTPVEQFGAKVMALDPATLALADAMGPLLR